MSPLSAWPGTVLRAAHLNAYYYFTWGTADMMFLGGQVSGRVTRPAKFKSNNLKYEKNADTWLTTHRTKDYNIELLPKRIAVDRQHVAHTVFAGWMSLGLWLPSNPA